MRFLFRLGAWVGLCALISAALPAAPAAPTRDLWAREDLVAWCIVPYDAKKRGPAERAAMLERLQLRRLAYDWRPEHVASFDEEVTTMKRHGIEIVAWWFPTKIDATAQVILDVIARHQIRPQLWISGGGEPTKTPDEYRTRVASETARIRPLADAAAKLGCKVGLYNHGGWFGEPENQLAVLAQLRAEGCANAGLVYNFHHGHSHLERFATMWPKIQADVLAVNLNGMVVGGDKPGQKILTIGEGDRELGLLRVIHASGWRGMVGILNHRANVDAEEGLQGNLDGLEKLVATLRTP